MWTNKYFDTIEKYNQWWAKNGHRYQAVPLFVNNGYGVQYRKLRVILND